MPEPLQIELPAETRRLLQIMAMRGGVLGDSEAEIAAYLVLRGVDDLFRCGVMKVVDSDA